MKRTLAQAALAVIAASLITTFAIAAPDHRTATQSWQRSVSAAPASKTPGDSSVEVEGGTTAEGSTQQHTRPEGGQLPGGELPGGGGGCIDTNTDQSC